MTVTSHTRFQENNCLTYSICMYNLGLITVIDYIQYGQRFVYFYFQRLLQNLRLHKLFSEFCCQQHQINRWLSECLPQIFPLGHRSLRSDQLTQISPALLASPQEPPCCRGDRVFRDSLWSQLHM